MHTGRPAGPEFNLQARIVPEMGAKCLSERHADAGFGQILGRPVATVTAAWASKVTSAHARGEMRLTRVPGLRRQRHCATRRSVAGVRRPFEAFSARGCLSRRCPVPSCIIRLSRSSPRMNTIFGRVTFCFDCPLSSPNGSAAAAPAARSFRKSRRLVVIGTPVLSVSCCPDRVCAPAATARHWSGRPTGRTGP